MPDDPLLPYYERELTFLRQMGAEFASKYPKIAGRLLLEADKSEDPHVERLIQAFAFLASRIHHKLDDEFPEITDALLGVLYPHYLAPIPSMSIAQFVLDPDQGKLTAGHHIPQGSMLYSQSVNGSPCRFRTCYPVTLWPLEVASARFDAPDRVSPSPKAAAVIRLELRCLGGISFADLELNSLRFFLHGESPLVYALYELLFNNTCQVQFRPLDDQKGVKPVVLPARCLTTVGFGPDEGVLPYTPRSFLGYRLLQEYFAFPEKFLFFDLGELDRAVRARFRSGVEVLLFLDKPPILFALEVPLLSICSNKLRSLFVSHMQKRNIGLFLTLAARIQPKCTRWTRSRAFLRIFQSPSFSNPFTRLSMPPNANSNKPFGIPRGGPHRGRGIPGRKCISL
jgi:type VI secretion system protein ImpG